MCVYIYIYIHIYTYNNNHTNLNNSTTNDNHNATPNRRIRLTRRFVSDLALYEKGFTETNRSRFNDRQPETKAAHPQYTYNITRIDKYTYITYIQYTYNIPESTNIHKM